MKKTYITPESELIFMFSQDIITYSFEEEFGVDKDPHKKDLDNWNIIK